MKLCWVVSLAWELVVSKQFDKRMEPRQRATTSWLCGEDSVDPVQKGFVAWCLRPHLDQQLI